MASSTRVRSFSALSVHCLRSRSKCSKEAGLEGDPSKMRPAFTSCGVRSSICEHKYRVGRKLSHLTSSRYPRHIYCNEYGTHVCIICQVAAQEAWKIHNKNFLQVNMRLRMGSFFHHSDFVKIVPSNTILAATIYIIHLVTMLSNEVILSEDKQARHPTRAQNILEWRIFTEVEVTLAHQIFTQNHWILYSQNIGLQ